MADKRISQLVDRGTVANNDVVPIVVSGATTTNKATISSIQTFMQGNLDLGVTSVGITLGSTGTDVNVSGSPVTSSGNITINIPTASAVNRGALSSADWTTFNSKQQAITLTTTGTSGAATLVSGTLNIPNYSTDLSGYVTLGTAQTITAQKTFTTSGSSDTMIISHGSGSGFALDVLKAGNGEAIRVTKTSGSGNAMTISGGNFEAGTIVKTGGTSSQFLKADGSVDSSSYALNSSLSLYLPLTGGTISGQLNVGSGNLRIAAEGASNITILRNFTGTAQGQSGFNNVGFNNSNNFYFTKNLNNGAIFAFTNTAYQTYTLQDASGTLAFTSQIPANPVGGTGTANIIPKFTGGSTLGDSSLQNVSNSISNLNPPSGQFAWQLNGNATTGQSFGALVVAGTNASDIAFAVRNTGGVTTLFEVQGDGNVGIGTNTPTDFGSTYKVLSIDGAGGGGVLDLMNTGVRTLTLAVDGGEASISSRVSGNPLIFKTNNAGTVATRLTIASTGAATFSSSVTTPFLRVTDSAGQIGEINSTNANGGYITWGTGGTTIADIGTAQQIFGTGGSGNFGINARGSRSLIFGTNNTARFTIDSTGAATFSSSVTAASGVFTLATSGGAIGSVRNLTLTNTSGALNDFAGINFAFYNNGTNFGYIGSILSNENSNGAADLVFGVKASNAATSVSEYMRIKFGGNVGIGTASPSANFILDINSTKASGASGMRLTTQSTSAGPIFVFNYTGSTLTNWAIGAHQSTAGCLEFVSSNSAGGDPSTAGTSRMLITSGGVLKASNTGSYDNTSSSSFEFINNTAGGNSFLVRNTSTSYTAALLRLTCDRTSTNNAYYLIIATNGNSSGEFRVADSGNVTNTTGSYGAISDIKLKENIQDASPKLDDLMKVKVRNYNLIGDDKKQIGVIAQELEEVFPAMIDESEDFEEVEVPQLDEEGNEVLNEEGEVVTEKQRVSKGTSTKSVKYSVFVPMLIKAMQEQQEQIQELKTEIDSLKNQIK